MFSRLSLFLGELQHRGEGEPGPALEMGLWAPFAMCCPLCENAEHGGRRQAEGQQLELVGQGRR